MPCTAHTKAKPPNKSKRAAHRPTKFSAELGEEICELVASGWLMKHAARNFGIPPETVCRWVVRHEAFREAYAVARAQRTEIWAEEIIEIADDATRDYTTDEHGNCVFNVENVHRARLRIEGRKWIMARLDPRLWANRPEIRVEDDWSLLSVEEREGGEAQKLIGVAEKQPGPGGEEVPGHPHPLNENPPAARGPFAPVTPQDDRARGR
jgi:hypothetical protein